ncbi:unnamed protein product [Arctia plantaginis]|uniref:Uncharacterized protein n=1 Tax=Arctia plantaginis TaxID=874455 RepID=A0A8S1APT2_ARCPL|nr:unnamed protein product [Arctia plantaginis]
MADKMAEQTKEVHSVCSCGHGSGITNKPATSAQDERILCMIESLTREIAALKTDRSRNNYRHLRKNHQRRPRSRSNSVNRTPSVCYFHRKFGNEAYRCRSPCTFEKKTNQTREN